MDEQQRKDMHEFLTNLEELIRVAPDRRRILDSLDYIKKHGKPGSERVINDYMKLMEMSHGYNDEEWVAMISSARRSLGNFCECNAHKGNRPLTKDSDEFTVLMDKLADLVFDKLKKQKGKDDLII